MQIKPFIIDLVRRLRQPTSMAGLAALGLLLGMAPGTVSAVAQAIVAVAAAAAVLIDDGSNAPVAIEGVEVTPAAPGFFERLGGLLRR